MSEMESAELGRVAQRLGLLTEEQLRDLWDELGPGADTDSFLRLAERKGFLTHWQTTKLLKGDRDGFFFGGYRVLYRIASGSFGRVFRGDDPRTGMVVAIKVLRRRWMEDPHKIELFEREGKIGLRLRHPNIVQILAVSRDAATSQHYIVMEFIEGWNLRDKLAQQKRLEPKEAVKILEESASALAYAYANGLTHRDIKPTNILISAHGGVTKLVDFGLADLAEGMTVPAPADEDGVTIDRTVDYAGLERATNVKAGDVRSDIFFLGVVFYEMLSGRPPMLMTRDRHKRMAKARFDSIQPLRPDEVAAPASVFNLLEHMIALDPESRYQTPQRLHEAVRKVQAELAGELVQNLGPSGPRTVFVVEQHPKLQDKIREKFKDLGFRVFMSLDPARALDRFEQTPYHAVVVDAGTAGLEGLEMFNRLQEEASLQSTRCAGILILNEDQAGWQEQVKSAPQVRVMVRPQVTLNQLAAALQELVPAEDGDGA